MRRETLSSILHIDTKAKESQKSEECLLLRRQLRGSNSREATFNCRIHSGQPVMVLAAAQNIVAFASKRAEVIFGPPESFKQNQASCGSALVLVAM